MPGEMATTLDVEFRLLLACSRIHADTGLIQNLADQTMDWQKVLGYSEWHGVTPQLCQRLEEANRPLASPASELIKSNSRRIAQQNLLFTAELLRIMGALVAENIPAIPYKGPVQAATTYGNLAMRSFCDLDILVSERNVPRLLTIMPTLGYRTEYNLSPSQEARYLLSACEYNFLHELSQARVEIHWQVIPPKFALKFEFDQLWPRSRPLRIGGSEIQVLSPEDALLVLSVHGFKHLWGYLKWVCDVASLVSAPDELDWPYIMREADRIGAMRVVLVALSLANQLCQSCVPDPIRLRLGRDVAAASIAREIVSSYSLGCSISPIKARLLMLRAYSGLRHRATYVARSLLDPATEELIRAPERSMSVLRAQQALHVARLAIFQLVNRKKTKTIDGELPSPSSSSLSI